jgi:outer membrane protein
MPAFPKSALRAILLALSFLSAAETWAQAKIGTVDMERVLKEYSKTKEAETRFNEAKDAAKKEFDERAEAYKRALEEINKLKAQLDAPILTTDAKASKARERDEKISNIKSMEREINEFRQTREQQLQQQMLRMRENLLKEITDVVMEQVKSRNLDLVFDKSGASLNRFSPILFSPDAMDFTADVVAELNKRTRAPAATPPAKPAKP